MATKSDEVNGAVNSVDPTKPPVGRFATIKGFSHGEHGAHGENHKASLHEDTELSLILGETLTRRRGERGGTRRNAEKIKNKCWSLPAPPDSASARSNADS